MAQDVTIQVVYWAEKKPSPKEIEQTINKFFNKAAQRVWWAKSNCIVHLVGYDDGPLIDYGDNPPKHVPTFERFLEVCPSGKELRVITRLQDAFTQACADGLAKFFMKTFGGSM